MRADSFVLVICPAVFNGYILTLGITGFLSPLLNAAAIDAYPMRC